MRTLTIVRDFILLGVLVMSFNVYTILVTLFMYLHVMVENVAFYFKVLDYNQIRIPWQHEMKEMLEGKLEESLWTYLLKLMEANPFLSHLRHQMGSKLENIVRNCLMKFD